jgi:uncharacterized protein YjbJ (UPF0337 family)
MNMDRFEGTLKQVSGTVKEQWGKFTKDAQREVAGQRDQRTGKSQVLYGISKDEAARQLKDFLDRNSNWHRWNK